MDIHQQRAAPTLHGAVDQFAHHRVEAVVERQRCGPLGRVERTVPHLQAPAGLGRVVDRAGTRPVEIHLEARGAHPEPGIADLGQQAGEGVFLTPPRLLVERDVMPECGTQRVAVVDRGRDHRSVGDREIPGVLTQAQRRRRGVGENGFGVGAPGIGGV